jgi:hypothetical protein
MADACSEIPYIACLLEAGSKGYYLGTTGMERRDGLFPAAPGNEDTISEMKTR